MVNSKEYNLVGAEYPSEAKFQALAKSVVSNFQEAGVEGKVQRMNNGDFQQSQKAFHGSGDARTRF